MEVVESQILKYLPYWTPYEFIISESLEKRATLFYSIL